MAASASGIEPEIPAVAAGRRPRVVILGGGFAGLNAAMALAKLPVDVTIIDRRNHHTFQPLLYQVALAVLSPADIATPIRSILRKHKNIEVLMGHRVRMFEMRHLLHMGANFLESLLRVVQDDHAFARIVARSPEELILVRADGRR